MVIDPEGDRGAVVRGRVIRRDESALRNQGGLRSSGQDFGENLGICTYVDEDVHAHIHARMHVYPSGYAHIVVDM